jgi:hypothetical protein
VSFPKQFTLNILMEVLQYKPYEQDALPLMHALRTRRVSTQLLAPHHSIASPVPSGHSTGRRNTTDTRAIVTESLIRTNNATDTMDNSNGPATHRRVALPSRLPTPSPSPARTRSNSFCTNRQMGWELQHINTVCTHNSEVG